MKRNIYLGVNVSKSSHPYTFVAMSEALDILAIGDGQLEEVLAYAAGDDTVKIAVNAPSSPNRGLMRQPVFRQRYGLDLDNIRWKNLRTGEFEVFQRGMKGTRTMATVGACPEWKRIGFTLYKYLQEIGYKTYPTSDGSKHWLEVSADVCYHVMLGRAPYPGDMLEGKIQRQLLLIELGFDIPDTMESFEEITRYRLLRGIFPFGNVYPLARLNAMIAAYMAYIAHSNQNNVVCLGEREEGLITIPAEPVIR